MINLSFTYKVKPPSIISKAAAKKMIDGESFKCGRNTRQQQKMRTVLFLPRPTKIINKHKVTSNHFSGPLYEVQKNASRRDHACLSKT